jgi:hypothetical protein
VNSLLSPVHAKAKIYEKKKKNHEEEKTATIAPAAIAGEARH